MLDVVNFRGRHAMLTMGLIVTFWGNASASPNTVTVQDWRPVAEAIAELENRYGWQITYEVPPYSNISDMPDVKPLVQENRSPAPAATVPKGSLSFALPPAGQDQASAVEALVKNYNASGGGNEFAVVHGARLLHVVPRKVRGLFGIVKPVLDTVITVEPKSEPQMCSSTRSVRKFRLAPTQL